MAHQNKPNRSAGFGLLVGVGLGVIVALVFKKLAIGVLLGIIVAYILYTTDQKK